MRPKIVTHTQVSLDGCIRGFENPGAHYTAAAKIEADAVLFGSDTVVEAFAQYPDESEAGALPPVDPEDGRPWCVIPFHAPMHTVYPP